MLANDADAEEAVQEALARAWRKRHQCRTAPLPWMLEITCKESLRIAARRRDERPLDSVAERPVPPADDEVVQRLDVRVAVARLAEDDRALLELRYGGDLTQSAVAERTGLPEGTVKVRLHRLRNTFLEAT